MQPNARERFSHAGVDVDLIRLFLSLTPEERIIANDKAIRAIEELRNGFKKAQSSSP